MAILRSFNYLTLTQQWIMATVLAMLPLATAILYAGASLADQTRAQRELVGRIDRLNSIESGVSEQVTELERSTRQYILIQNPRLLELFQQNLNNLDALDKRAAESLRALSFPKPQALTEIMFLARELRNQLQQHSPEDGSESILPLLQQAKEQAKVLSEDVNNLIQSLLDDSDRQFERVLQHLMIIGFLTIPGTILLVTMSSVVVARPMWRLAGAIRELGHENWQQPIAIDGPADLRSLGQSLEWMRLRLMASDRQKRTFLRHITHELKTPLAAIMEAGWLLRDEVPGEIGPSQRNVLEILLRNAENLQDLIQQLLNYNTVVHGMMSSHDEVDLQALCEKIRTRLMETRLQMQREYTFEGTPRCMVTDRQAMEMILTNLLSNAHDFAAESGKVAVRWGQEATYWWLTVEDNGPGISAEDLDSVFKPFYQGTARRLGPLKGTGLGLAIVQECTLHLGGEITVHSGAHQGTRFELHFPLNNENNV